MIIKNKIILLISIFLIVILVSQLSRYIFFQNKGYTYGQIISIKRGVKGGYHYIYNFKNNGKVIYGFIYTNEIKDNIDFDSLKNIPNIKIEYSKYSTNFNRIIDKRILK